MAQAIITKYVAPTNSRGSRVVVKSWMGKTCTSWNHTQDERWNHAAAITEHIEMLRSSTGCEIKLVGGTGSLPDGSGYAVIVI